MQTIIVMEDLKFDLNFATKSSVTLKWAIIISRMIIIYYYYMDCSLLFRGISTATTSCSLT